MAALRASAHGVPRRAHHGAARRARAATPAEAGSSRPHRLQLPAHQGEGRGKSPSGCGALALVSSLAAVSPECDTPCLSQFFISCKPK